MSHPQTMTPTAPGERILTIDVLRGFALLGILLVNMEFFTHSYYDFIFGLEVPSTADRWAHALVQFFAEGKFYSMFSFLFGLGMAIFMQRCEAKGIPFVPIYTRRLLALLGFGLIHAYLLWFGDILIVYSIIGFLTLYLLRNLPPRRLLILAGAFLLIPILINAVLWGLMAMGKAAAPDVMAQQMAAQMEYYANADAASDLAYSQGSYLDTVRDRARVMNLVFSTMPFMIFNVWAMFLVGLAAGKARLHERLPQEKALLKKVLLWGGVVGLIGNLIFVLGMQNADRVEVDGLSWLATTAQTIGAPALSLAYMAGISLLLMDARRLRRAAPVAAAGRMAITNYLMQTVICTTIMYGYGLGYYGMGQAAASLLAISIWLLQLALSVLWLRWFRFGPVEWLWRTITYWRLQPIRRGAGGAQPGGSRPVAA